MILRRCRLAGIAVAFAIAATPAIGGPPYATDDPVPTDLHHWEIYVFGDGSRSGRKLSGSAGVDLNYGALPGVQLTATLPIGYGSGPVAAGNAEIGVKYRFFENAAEGIAVAVFPRAYLPTAGRRYGSGRVAVLLPVWAEKDVGPWSIFGGGGYTINPGAGNRSFWQGGLAVTRRISERLSLGAEVTGQGADADDARRYAALNVGATLHIAGPFSWPVARPPGLVTVRDDGRANVYTALAIVF